jgi:hypothetical protein
LGQLNNFPQKNWGQEPIAIQTNWNLLKKYLINYNETLGLFEYQKFELVRGCLFRFIVEPTKTFETKVQNELTKIHKFRKEKSKKYWISIHLRTKGYHDYSNIFLCTLPLQ